MLLRKSKVKLLKMSATDIVLQNTCIYEEKWHVHVTNYTHKKPNIIQHGRRHNLC